MEPITVSVIGTSSGTGGVSPPSGTMAETPAGQPDIRVNRVHPLIAIAVRFGHIWLRTTLGALGLQGADSVLNLNMLPDATPLGVLQMAALSGLAAAVVGLGWDFVTVFKDLEKRYPLLTGSI